MVVETYGILFLVTLNALHFDALNLMLFSRLHVLRLDKDSCRHSLSVVEQIALHNLVSPAYIKLRNHRIWLQEDR